MLQTGQKKIIPKTQKEKKKEIYIYYFGNLPVRFGKKIKIKTLTNFSKGKEEEGRGGNPNFWFFWLLEELIFVQGDR